MSPRIKRFNSVFLPSMGQGGTVAMAAAAIAIFAAGAGSGAYAETGGASKKANMTFALDFVPDGLHAPVYVAENKGYTGKVKLLIQPGGGSSLTTKLVSTGQAQMGIADAGTVSAAVAKGAKVKAVALLLKHTPAVTVVSMDSGIKKISDLRGKSVGDFPEASTSVLLPAVLKANGLSQNDITFVGMNFSVRVPSLESKRVDAIDGYVQEFVSLPDSYRRIVWADNNFDIYGPILIVNNDFAKEHPDAVRTVIAGIKKGLQFTAEHPKEAADITAKASRGDAKYFESELVVLKPFFADPASMNMTPQDWDAVQDVMMQYGGQPTKVENDVLFTNEFIETK